MCLLLDFVSCTQNISSFSFRFLPLDFVSPTQNLRSSSFMCLLLDFVSSALPTAHSASIGPPGAVGQELEILIWGFPRAKRSLNARDPRMFLERVYMRYYATRLTCKFRASSKIPPTPARAS